jgi:hypothetical protein
LKLNHLRHLATAALLTSTTAYADSIDWGATEAPPISEHELLPEVFTTPAGGGEGDFLSSGRLFNVDQRPIYFLPMASSGKNCGNPHGFPHYRTLWEPNPNDPAGRPPAVTGVFRKIDRGWDQGYRRFMLHRFGGDQAGGSYSAAQWWNFPEDQRFWWMREDFDPATGEPMGLKAYISQKKAEDPDAEFHLYLGFIMLKVDSLIQEEAPFSETLANYWACDPMGDDPLNLIPEGLENYQSRSMCMDTGDEVGKMNQLWLTLGAFIDMGFDGAYFDALGSGNGLGAVCAGDIAALPQYADRGFRIGIEPMAVERSKDGRHMPMHENLPAAPSVSNYRFISWRMGVSDREADWNPEFDLRGTNAEAAVIMRWSDWAEEPGAGENPDGFDLTIDRFFQVVQHGYTPTPQENPRGRQTEEAIALVMDVGEMKCPPDISFDGRVDFNDILLLIDRWRNPPPPVMGTTLGRYHGDYHDDDRLTFADLAVYIRQFSRGCG